MKGLLSCLLLSICVISSGKEIQENTTSNNPVSDDFKSYKLDIKADKVKINIEMVDCDKDSKTADKYDVQGYPTIKLVHGSKIIEYEAKPQLDTLKQFLDVAI